MNPQEREAARVLVELALAEDHAEEDLTARLALSPDATVEVVIRNREGGTVCGVEIAAITLEVFASSARAESRVADGKRCDAGEELVRLTGRWRDIVSTERTILNLMGMLSGTATLTRAFVDAAGSTCRVLDTRKTYPGARLLQKYAVRCGGGENHRFHLADGFLVKDNHRHGGLSWTELVARARAENANLPVVIEVDSLDQFEEVLPLRPDRILLDNFDLADIRRAREIRDRVESPVGLEVSGGIRLETVAAVAAAGADCVSVGALTHSAPAWDIGMDLVDRGAES